jgi:glycosyltransferase involved in cell wall biosynthesis
MILGKKLIVIMPAYNAEKTLRQTYEGLPHDLVDEVILTDDASQDATVRIAGELGIKTVIHTKNLGYGGSQKTCYREALKHGGEIVVMLHPDYQYSPRLVAAMASMVASGHYDVVLGSRILGGRALQGGMPRYKYFANRILTFFENMVLGEKLSEYHTGFRAFTREVLTTLPLAENSDDFVFDCEIIVQTIHFKFRIGELSCPTRYFPEASSIGFKRSIIYGLGVVSTLIRYCMVSAGFMQAAFLSGSGKKIIP